MKDLIRKTEMIAFFLLIWIVLHESITLLNILTGLVISMFTLYLTNLILGIDYAFVFYESPFALLKYFFYLIKEVYKSGYDMFKRIIRGDISPTFLTYESKLTDPLSLVLLSNSCTLTPGTATVEREGNSLVILSADPDVVGVREGLREMEQTLVKLERER